MKSPPQEHSSIPYRPEIDGLRAISVIGVILFHYRFGFPGGYVGVDVFFVISGYLISSIILREIESGQFTFSNFWCRRIRRILPAASAVSFCTLIAGLIILDPVALENLAKSAVANSLMLSNVFFWSEAGYFSEAAELKPLLHTWSLAIEEQFYVFLPILLVVLAKLKQSLLRPLLILAFLGSLVLSILTLKGYPGATFYFLPTRCWELLAGTLTALLPAIQFSRILRESLSILGLVLIVGPMFLYGSDIPFPGWTAIPPVLGAAIFIQANRAEPTMGGKVLSYRPNVIIGQMSYSLYLWHWPILAFAHHMLVEISIPARIIMVFLTLVLSIASWKLVENPFRRHTLLKKNSAAFTFGAVLLLAMLGASTLYYLQKGFPERFDPNVKRIMEDVSWTGTEYKETSSSPSGSIRLGNNSPTKADYILWGDSHGMALASVFDIQSKEAGVDGIALLYPAQPPVSGLWMPRMASVKRESFVSEVRSRLDWILSQDVEHLVLVARWDALCAGDTGDRHDGKDPLRLMVSDTSKAETSPQESAGALKRQLQAMLGELNKAGIRVWILLQVPEVSDPDIARKFMLSKRFSLFNKALSPEGTSRADYLERRNLSESTLRSLKAPNLQIIDPIDQFFPSNGALTLYEDSAYYRDPDHLTKSGAEKYMSSTIRKLLEEFKKPES